MSHTYIDEKGRTWHEFTAEYRHELDDRTYGIRLWAIDFADAQERLGFIGSNGVITGRLLEIIK